jgi:hypothetical protein
MLADIDRNVNMRVWILMIIAYIFTFIVGKQSKAVNNVTIDWLTWTSSIEI